MKRLLATSVFLIVLSVAAQAAVQLELDAGILRNKGGASVVPVGGLLQLIASPSGSAANFVAPTANSFVGGDNIVVASFAMNNNGGRIGEFDGLINFTLANTGTPSATTFDAGDPLLLRWYPTLTFANLGTYSGPGSGTTYGQFRSATAVDGGAAWITPGDNTTTTVLVFATTDASGSQPIASGYASNTVPEPSAGLFCGLGLVIAMSARQIMRRQRNLR